MSEHIPIEVTSALGDALSKRQSRRSKYDKTKLPTPPPDPTESRDPKDRDVFDYLESLIPNYTRSTSTFAPVIATDDAFDHLEKLYKLMEQMLELREQNAKLHRRIRDLEHLNNLERMHKELEASGAERDCPELDRDTAFAETILESILADSSRNKKLTTSPSLRPSILRRQRNRSGSGAEKQVTLDANAIVLQEDGCDNCDKSAKVSKWTKVKAAFRWEKASTSVADTKSQDSGIHVPVNLEIARYLRVPSTSDDLGHSPADSGAAGISTPGSLSTTSSNEDFHRSDLRTTYEDFRSSDDEHSHHNYIPQSKDEHGSAKLHPKYHYRTPWAKMKDIIQTRNSFKKKHRLSAASDDIQIDVEFCSDNEDVFDDEPKSKTIQIPPSSIPQCSIRYARVNSSDISPEVIERYQKALAETSDKKVSKWTIVKKAFITNEGGRRSPASPKDSNIEDEIQRSYRQLQNKLSIEFQEKLSEWERLKQSSPCASNPSSACGFVEENRDPNFIKKMEEWQKIKGQQPTGKTQMPSELDLPPDFKKKLQEWEKIKKSSAKETSSSKKKLGEVGRWKSLSGHRYDTTTAIDYPALSEDFRRKLDEWKQIKSCGGSVSSTETGQKKPKEKTPSPRLIRKNSSPKHSKKQKGQDKELHWYEKELGKIEKEKQRLERERQKFLEREERLSKLRKSITGGNKKEVLIHTPSGFYRFEGISRKFTQKLYEWEKAKGIGPEASTFALLSSSYTPETRPTIKRHSAPNTPPLTRSKSADSIAISALNLTCPLMNQQPSSLSLNDVEELEKECLADSKASSMRYLLESQEAFDLDEPEAVLIEVEDYEEETAAPLQTWSSEKHQLPIYQREEVKALCEGETVAAPKVRKSESARAQANYNLIEESVNILRQLAENEVEVKNLIQFGGKIQHTNENRTKLKELCDGQQSIVKRLSQKLICLQEANLFVASTLAKEEGQNQGHVRDILESVQDLSVEIVQMAERMDQNVKNRSIDNVSTTFLIFENIRDIRSKLLELRRHLSYVCASTDLTAPGRKLSGKKKTLVQKTLSNDSRSSRCDTTSDNSRRGSQKEEKRYIKFENSTSTSGQGAVKKRIKYRQKTLLSRSMPADTDDEEENGEKDRKNYRHKKLTRSRTISDSNTEDKPLSEMEISEPLTQKVIVPTETNYVNVVTQEENKMPPESPLTLFVKTTRKLFTPIGEAGLSDSGRCVVNLESPRILVEPAPVSIDEGEVQTKQEEVTAKLEQDTEVTASPQESVRVLPPLPPSPVPQRKVFKDISPSIRLMMAKYNQKISEQDKTSTKSGNSSGSNSPVAWRSPAAERRVMVQMEKYQEELKKLSPQLGGRREVQKSASIGYLNLGNRQVTVPVPARRESVQESLLSNTPSTKSTATNSDTLAQPPRKQLALNISHSHESSRHSPEIRLQKIQKAKEEFLRSTPKSAPPQLTSDDVLQFPTRNRLSQISVDSESSYDNVLPGALIKSASVGMINIDPDTYRQIDPELHGGGYVSLPRNTKSPKSSKFGFANIASKFRKVRMRKGKEKDKDKEKPNAVAALCRHSLVVDITNAVPADDRNVSNDAARLPPPCNHSSSQDVRRRSDSPSPSSSTAKSNTSWLKRSLFRK